MKKYFAKYLPIEGKIKDGDRWSGVLNGETIISPYKWNDTDDEDDLIDPEVTEVKIVRLFMCSRDIQVGDKFNNTEIPDKDYIADVITEKDIECYEHDCFVPKKYCIKVIGEISPYATWVMEGNEFDEDDFYVTDECPNYNRKHMWKDCSCKMGFVKGVYIKSSLDTKK